jgi:hypothetical protein
MPNLGNDQLCYWLRAFFDAEPWIEIYPGKSRLIGMDCCNKRWLFQIKSALKRLGINSNISKRKGGTIWRLVICGKENLIRYQKMINYLHPMKKKKLIDALNSYLNQSWHVPFEYNKLLLFVIKKGKYSKRRLELRFNRVILGNLTSLSEALNSFNIPNMVLGPWKNGLGREYYCLVISNWRKSLMTEKKFTDEGHLIKAKKDACNHYSHAMMASKGSKNIAETGSQSAVPDSIKNVGVNVWEIPTSFKKGMLVPARVYANDELLAQMDKGVFDQVTNVASLPGIQQNAFCMPDGHI